MSYPIRRLLLPIVLLTVGLAACTPGASSPSENASAQASAEISAAASVTVSAACADAMIAAASTNDISAATADLIGACHSLAEFVAAAEANPLALNGASPQSFAEDACSSIDALKDKPLCVELAAPGS